MSDVIFAATSAVVLIVVVVLTVVVELSCELLYQLSSLLPALSQPLLSSHQLSFHRIGFVGTHAGCYETEGFLNVKTVTRLLIYQIGQSSNCPHGNLFGHGFALRVKIW